MEADALYSLADDSVTRGSPRRFARSMRGRRPSSESPRGVRRVDRRELDAAEAAERRALVSRYAAWVREFGRRELPLPYGEAS